MPDYKDELNCLVRSDDAVAFVIDILVTKGLTNADARLVGKCIVDADLRGVETHGLIRLPGYVDRLERGLMNPKPKIKITGQTSVCASLDGDNGFGFLAASRGMQEAITMASEHGIGVVSAFNSNHFGMAASYLIQAVDSGFFAFAFTNSARSMPPWGGRKGLFGTSPFAAAAPAGVGPPFILDMSPAIAARGKFRLAEKRGEKIPDGFALDKDGKPTTDPTEALEGVVLPIGGYKGSGIAMLMDILSGVVSGAGFAGGVRDQYTDWDGPQNVGHFFLAMQPGIFINEKEFRDRMDILVSEVKSNPLAQGHKEILIPGEKEAKLSEERKKNGIPYAKSDIQVFGELAARCGVPFVPFKRVSPKTVSKIGK